MQPIPLPQYLSEGTNRTVGAFTFGRVFWPFTWCVIVWRIAEYIWLKCQPVALNRCLSNHRHILIPLIVFFCHIFHHSITVQQVQKDWITKKGYLTNLKSIIKVLNNLQRELSGLTELWTHDIFLSPIAVILSWNNFRLISPAPACVRVCYVYISPASSEPASLFPMSVALIQHCGSISL